MPPFLFSLFHLSLKKRCGFAHSGVGCDEPHLVCPAWCWPYESSPGSLVFSLTAAAVLMLPPFLPVVGEAHPYINRIHLVNETWKAKYK